MRIKLCGLIACVAMLAAGIVSCQQHDDIPQDVKYPILFDSPDTRATATKDDLKANGFRVWAYITNTTVENHLLMENQLVEYDESEDKWFYSPVEYWLDNTVFTFVGVYPYDENGTYYSLDAANAAVKLTVDETPSEVDFLIAKNTTDTKVEGYSPTVDLPFQHVLTSVGLNIWRDQGKHQNDDMRIKSVTLGNIIKSGVYSSATGSWTNNNNDKLTLEMLDEDLTDSDNIGAVTVKDDGSLDAGGDKPASPFGEMMLLPQTLDDSNVVSLKIVYELKRNNAADWEEAELEAVLPSITWKAGQRYTYNVVLSSVTDITVYYIQTKVDPWGTPQVGGTVIIK